MRPWGLIVGAGRGERLGYDVPKALVKLLGEPMVIYSISAMVTAVERIVVVLPPGYAPELPVVWRIVEGGPTRQASVRAGLAAIPGAVESVVIHDAARPNPSTDLVRIAIGGLKDADGAICAVRVVDTLKRVNGEDVVTTVPRDGLWRAQTPQAFRLGPLRAAHEQAVIDGFEATDDATLLERYGGRVVVVPGDERNIKVTTMDDLSLAETLLRPPQ